MTIRLIVGLIVLVILVGGTLSITGRKEYRAEITIPASPEDVWAVLADTSNYGAWNPVFVRVDGQYRDQQHVTNHVQPPTGDVLKIKNRIEEIEVNRYLRQRGGVPGIITFDHSWTLEPTANGTRVTQFEIDRGAYVWFWDDSWVQPAYGRVNQALHDRVLEQLQ